MRTVKQARTALERQVLESVIIDKLSHKVEACLNLKNEWGHSKNPSLLPKAGPTASPNYKQEGGKQRMKRGQYSGSEEREQESEDLETQS